MTNQAVKICENGQFQFNNRHLSINPATAILTSAKYQTVIGTNPFIPGDKLDENEASRQFLYQMNDILNKRLKTKAVDLMACNIQETPSGLVVVDICTQITHLA